MALPDSFLSWPSVLSLAIFEVVEEVELAEEPPTNEEASGIARSPHRTVLISSVVVLLGLSAAAALHISWLDFPVLIDSAAGEEKATAVVSGKAMLVVGI